MPEITPPMQAKGVVHHQIATTAKGLARAYWEETATKSNEFYAACPDDERFVETNWAEFIPIARSIMTDMLGMTHMPTGERITDKTKADIYDALKLDGAINARKVQKNNLITPDSGLILPTHRGGPRVH